MMKRKRLFTAVLSLIMTLSLLPANILAEEEAPVTGFTAEEETILPADIEKLKTKTVKLKAWLAGNNTDKPNAVISLKVNLK